MWLRIYQSPLLSLYPCISQCIYMKRSLNLVWFNMNLKSTWYTHIKLRQHIYISRYYITFISFHKELWMWHAFNSFMTRILNDAQENLIQILHLSSYCTNTHLVSYTWPTIITCHFNIKYFFKRNQSWLRSYMFNMVNSIWSGQNNADIFPIDFNRCIRSHCVSLIVQTLLPFLSSKF